jgi:hypothetical protein
MLEATSMINHGCRDVDCIIVAYVGVRGKLWQAVRLLASEEGICSLQLVGEIVDIFEI